jgi:hypothetical protein
MAMADHTAAPFLVDPIGVRRQEGGHLGLDRVGQHLPGTFTQHCGVSGMATTDPPAPLKGASQSWPLVRGSRFQDHASN